jgi:glutaredoxin
MFPLIALLAMQDFFEKPSVDFWGTRQEKPPVPVEAIFEPGMAPEVKRLLEDPSPENARAYLEIQAERMKRIRRALEAVQAQAAKIQVYTLPGCPACERQLEVLKDAPWKVEILPPSDAITRYPTLVVNGKTLVGFQTLEQIRRVIHD